MTFLAPLLLTGLALASVPIIIHLLNRRRFRYVEWGPMHYLKLTLKTNRRRLRLEQWLLLALRTLAVAALFLAVARPAVSGTGFGAWLAGRSRTARVIVIDDSLSTDARGSTRSAFDRIRDASAALVGRIGSQDSVTALTTTAPTQPLMRDGTLDDPEPLIGSIRSLKPRHTANHWASTFSAVDDALKTAAFPLREVTLITDLRARGWDAEVTEVAERWAADGVKLRIIDAGVEPSPNLVLVSLTQDRAVVLAGEKAPLTARVRNDGAESLTGVAAILTVDGDARPLVLPDLSPGEAVDVPLTVTFTDPGTHTVQLALPADGLPADNTRSHLLEVRKTLEVLLVDGEPGAQPFQGETDFLAVAYSVGRTPWNIQRTVDSEWLSTPLAAPDVTVLANVATIPESRATELREMVEAGMGLMIFLGSQVEAEPYNTVLFQEGRGVMPARILGVEDVSDEQPVAGLVVESLSDSPLDVLAKVAPQSIARIRPKRLARLALPADAENVRVLARWNDPDGTPAIVEKRIGRGRVLLWNTTADRGWGDWPTDPTYVLANREAAIEVAGGGGRTVNLMVSSPLRIELDPSRLPIAGSLRDPGQTSPITLPVDASALTVTDTHTAGIYQVDWEEPGTGAKSRGFALNPDARESDLAAIDPLQLAALLGSLKPQVIPFDSDAVADGDSKELWHTLATILVTLLVGEMLLAAWIDRGR